MVVRRPPLLKTPHLVLQPDAPQEAKGVLELDCRLVAQASGGRADSVVEDSLDGSTSA
jgi:hypothetical protein